MAADKKRKRVLGIAGALVLLLVLGAVTVGMVLVQQRRADDEAAAARAAEEAAIALHQEQADELREVFDAVAAVDSATMSATTARDYSSKLERATAALDKYEAPDKDAKRVVSYLESALEKYATAMQIWDEGYTLTGLGTTFQEGITLRQQEGATALGRARGALQAYEEAGAASSDD